MSLENHAAEHDDTTSLPWLSDALGYDQIRVHGDFLAVEFCEYATGACFDLTPEFVDQLIGQLQTWKAAHVRAVTAAAGAGRDGE